MLVKLEDGRKKDVPVTQVTKENYICDENEKHLYHCIIEVRKFNPETGERLSIPRVQKFGKKTFENGVADNLRKQGYSITILHEPIIESEAEKQKRLAEAEAERIAMFEAEKQKAIAEAVAKALAEAEAEKQKAIEEAVAEATKKKGKKAETAETSAPSDEK